MASDRMMEIMCWYTKLMNHLNIFPFVLVLHESTFTIHHYVGSSGSEKCARNMHWSLAVQFLLESYLILQTYFNFVDAPSVIQSVSLFSIFSAFLLSQAMWWKQMDSLVYLINEFLEFNAELGMLYAEPFLEYSIVIVVDFYMIQS
jgi:hypothetical protein